MGELVEAAKALSAPATKLIEVVSRGIGRAYDPRYKRKMTDATIYEINALAEVMRQNSDLPFQIIRDGVQIDTSDFKALAERANSRFVFQEIRKQQNIESIVEKAYKEVETFTEVSSEPVDDDWIVRFFNSVEDVSNEKLQEVWAKILAGEIKKPRSSSMRTLDLLKNMSVDEAVLFEKVSVCVLESVAEKYIPNESDLLKEYGVVFRDLFNLSNAGLLNLNDLTINFEHSSTPYELFNSEVICTLASSSEKSPKLKKIPVRCLTSAGTELLGAIQTNSVQRRDFALNYFKKLKLENEDLIVCAFELISISGNKYRYKSEDLLA